MASNAWARTISVTASFQPLSDTPLILRAQVLIWSVGATPTPLDLEVTGQSAQLPNNREFTLDGVDLSNLELQP